MSRSSTTSRLQACCVDISFVLVEAIIKFHKKVIKMHNVSVLNSILKDEECIERIQNPNEVKVAPIFHSPKRVFKN